MLVGDGGGGGEGGRGRGFNKKTEDHVINELYCRMGVSKCVKRLYLTVFVLIVYAPSPRLGHNPTPLARY